MPPTPAVRDTRRDRLNWVDCGPSPTVSTKCTPLAGKSYRGARRQKSRDASEPTFAGGSIMLITKQHLIAPILLGFCLLAPSACAPPGGVPRSQAQIPPIAPGM